MSYFKNNFWFPLGGFFILSFTFYNKFLKPRLTGPIDFTYSDFKFYFYIVMIISFLIPLILLILFPVYKYYLLKKEVTVESIKRDNTVFTKIHLYFVPKITRGQELYGNMIEAFYLPWVRDSFSKKLSFWKNRLAFVQNSEHFRLIINLFFFLPPCLISSCYLLETIKHEYTYFPYIVFLMSSPILIRVYLYNVQLFCRCIEEDCNARIYLKEQRKDYDVFAWVENSTMPKHQQTQHFLDFIVQLKQENLENIELLKNCRQLVYTLPERIYYSMFSLTCWLLSFSYMLYKILENNNI